MAHAVEAEADGDVACCHVGDGHGDEVGAYTIVALLIALQALILNGGETADAAGEYHAAALAVLVFHHQAAVLHGLGGAGQSELHKAVGLANLALVDVLLGLKAAHLARQLYLLVGGVVLGNGADAAGVGLYGGPAFLQGQAQGSHRAHAGDYNASFIHL